MDSGGEKVRGHSTEEGDDASSVCHRFSRQCCFSLKAYSNTQLFLPSVKSLMTSFEEEKIKMDF